MPLLRALPIPPPPRADLRTRSGIPRPPCFRLRNRRRALSHDCGSSLNSLCGGTDHVEHQLRVRQHWDVTAVGLVRGRADALRAEALELWVDGAVLLGDDVPARLRLPGGAFNLPIEQVDRRRIVSRPHELLLFLGKISCKAF